MFVQVYHLDHLSVGWLVGLSGKCIVAKQRVDQGAVLGGAWGWSRDVCIRWRKQMKDDC